MTLSPELESAEAFRAAFPLVHYHCRFRNEFIFGVGNMLVQRRYDMACESIPDFIVYYNKAPVGVWFDNAEMRVHNLILALGEADVIPAEKVRLSRNEKLYYVRDARLYRLDFDGPSSYPIPMQTFVSADPEQVEQAMLHPLGMNSVVLDSGIAARLDGDDLTLFKADKPEQKRVIRDSGLRGHRLYTNGDNVLVLDGNSLITVKTRKG